MLKRGNKCLFTCKSPYTRKWRYLNVRVCYLCRNHDALVYMPTPTISSRSCSVILRIHLTLPLYMGILSSVSLKHWFADDAHPLCPPYKPRATILKQSVNFSPLKETVTFCSHISSHDSSACFSNAMCACYSWIIFLIFMVTPEISRSLSSFLRWSFWIILLPFTVCYVQVHFALAADACRSIVWLLFLFLLPGSRFLCSVHNSLAS